MADARLAVLDLGGVWRRWEGLGREALKAWPGVEVEVRPHGPVPRCEAVLVLVPPQGLERQQYIWLREARLPPSALQFAAAMNDEDLLLTPRNVPAHLGLAEEIKREFDVLLLMVPVKNEEAFVGKILDLCVERAVLEAGSAVARQVEAHVGELARTEGLTTELPSLETLASFDDLALGVTRGRQALCLAEAIDVVAAPLAEHAQAVRDHAAHWEELAHHLRDECARQARNAEFHGGLAEEVIAGMAEVVNEVTRELDAWRDPPFPELEAWRLKAREDLKIPSLCLPVAGVFSSGKTTLFNYLLGKTPKGWPRLRTSAVHNTALLCHFHHRRTGKNRVEIVYRPTLQLSLVSPQYPSEVAVCAPVAGTVQTVLPRADGGTLVMLRTVAGRQEWIFLDQRHPLLPNMRRGTSVNAGDALSRGPRRQDWDQRYVDEDDEASVILRVKVAQAMIRFLDSGRLKDAEWELRCRVVNRLRRLQIEATRVGQRDDPERFARWRDWLEAQVRTALGSDGEAPEERTLVLPADRHAPAPIEMRLSGRVDASKESSAHALETDADWDWFQGPVTPGDSRQTRTLGFSEGDAAAYLAERADLHLNAPVFQLVSLVDTPGLNSITELHERITEEVIHRGQAFLLLCRLDRGVYEEATARAIASMIAALDEQGIDPEDRADRIFLVLNWFRGNYLARNEQDVVTRVKEFRDLASRMIGAAEVKVYLVDLSPAAFHREWPETLLEVPSLRRLVNDISGFLDRHGLSPRLHNLASSLRRVWSEKQAELNRRQRVIEAQPGDRVAVIRKMIEILGPRGALRVRLHATIDHTFDGTIEPVHDLRQRLASLDDKGDFERLQTTGPGLMKEYNTRRHFVGTGLVRELNGTFRAQLRDLDQIPEISRTPDEASELPTMAHGEFSRQIGAVVSGWPSGWGRFWKLLENGEWHRTTNRNALIREFTPAARISEIERKVKTCRDKFKGSVDESCAAALADLAKQLEVATASDKRRQSEADTIAAERDKLRAFHTKYAKLLKLLDDSGGGTSGAARSDEAT